jgi:RsiW-degrading membrane proteinase PrsW (M82 family)
MLTTIAIGKSVAFPVLIAGVLVALLRRSGNPWCLLAAFLSGVLGAFSLNDSILRNLPSMLPDGQVQATTTGQAWLSGFVDAAIPEEIAKGVWILVFLIGWRQYSSRHGALIGGLVGLGFALRENLSYAQTAPEWRVMAAFSHAAWGVIMGNLLQRAVIDTPWRFHAILWAFIPPILLHGLLDSSIFLVEAYESKTGLNPTQSQATAVLSPVLFFAMLTTFAVDIFSIAWAIRVIRILRREPVSNPSLA